MTHAPPGTAARYVVETQPDGEYVPSRKDEWSLKVQRRGGALYPVGYTGGLEAVRAAFPDINPKAN